jgi:predicted ferric reductase
LLLVVGVLLSLYYSKLKQDYNTWRIFHKAMILVIILAFSHSILIGDAFDLNWVKIWWSGLTIFACTIFFLQNYIIIPFGRKKYSVRSVIKETHDTFTLSLEPAGNPGKPVFDFKPGQFMFLELKYKGRRSEAHPFTISSPPSVHGNITATIKKSGNYTEMIDQTQVNDVVLLQAPFGRFSYYFDNPSCFLFIAGGVGITPIHSMMATLRDIGDKRSVVLIYTNKTEEDIIFFDELEKLPANFKVIHILSRAGNEWKGLTGHINAEIIMQHANTVLAQAHIYLCGPPAMMEQGIHALSSLGVTRSRIKYERFTI